MEKSYKEGGINGMEKFIITPGEDTSVTMTIRIDRVLQEEYKDFST